MAYTNYISSKQIVYNILSTYGREEDFDDMVYEHIDRAIDQIITADNYKTYVDIVNLHNYKSRLPKNFRFPLQVSYRREEEAESNDLQSIQRFIVEGLSKNCENTIVEYKGCSICKSKEKCGCKRSEWYPIEVDSDYITLSKYPSLAEGYSNFMYGYEVIGKNENVTLNDHFKNTNPKGLPGANISSKRKTLQTCSRLGFAKSKMCNQFQLIRPTQNYLFNLPGRIQECNVPSYDTNIEYNIDDGVIEVNACKPTPDKCPYGCAKYYGDSNRYPLYTNNQHHDGCPFSLEPDDRGQLLIAYLGRRIDENGFLMIPNEPYIIEAITDYVIERLAFTKYSISLEQKDERFWQNMVQISRQKIAAAKSRFRMPNHDEWEMFVENHWLKRIPYRNYKKHNNTSRPDLYRLPDATYIY